MTRQKFSKEELEKGRREYSEYIRDLQKKCLVQVLVFLAIGIAIAYL